MTYRLKKCICESCVAVKFGGKKISYSSRIYNRRTSSTIVMLLWARVSCFILKNHKLPTHFLSLVLSSLKRHEYKMVIMLFL